MTSAGTAWLQKLAVGRPRLRLEFHQHQHQFTQEMNLFPSPTLVIMFFNVRTILFWQLLSSTCFAQEEPVLLLNNDTNFHFQILNTLGLAIYSGADISPVLNAAQSIAPGNFTSFSDAFYNLACTTKAAAMDAESSYGSIDVRDTWFAASTYFRAADFYLHGNWSDPLINELWNEQLFAFDKAIAALPIPGKRLQIPSDNFTVEAIWYSASRETSLRPTLILGNGYDGSQEDLYHTIVVPALARGWNCITYEGPGQPLVRRRQNLGFVHDWERVVTPVVDYVLESQASVVDPSRLVLFGFSFGGYLAARAAAFEPRLSAVMLDGGIFDTYESFSSQLPPVGLEVLESGNKTAFDALASSLAEAPDAPTALKWGIEQGLWSFKSSSAYDFMQIIKLYNLKDVIHKISVPVWTADAEFEDFFVNQSMKVKEALGDQATYHQFKGAAGYHCQVGAFQELNSVMFSWLAKTLGISK
jgi:pimeloyl-ACP methyl ester carboxylesterase